MALVPLVIRKSTPPMDTQSKPLTGTQRMRGLYFNYGTSDVGPDPDWDPHTKQWKGWERRERRTGAIKVESDEENEK